MTFQHTHVFQLSIILLCLITLGCFSSQGPEQLFAQCLAYYEKHELDAAASCFEKARTHREFKTRAAVMLARVRYFQSKYAEARGLLEDIIDYTPAHTHARYWLARTLVVDPQKDGTEERETKAIEHLKQILEVDPHHVRARSLLALLYEKRNMHREALYEYLAALEEEETLLSARANLGILYRRLGLSERAKNEIERAIAISKAAEIPAKNLIEIKKELSEK